MLYILSLLNLIFHFVIGSNDYGSDDSFDGNLVSELRNDVNLDLPVDEEYEDLRAEFLAYHTALASLSQTPSMRRSMISTPCWKLGGICINYKLCTGFRSLTQVPGCKDKHNVCCFVWNRYIVKDFREVGIGNQQFPWGLQEDFGGKGVVPKLPKKKREKKKQLKVTTSQEKKTVAVILYK